MSQRLIVGAGDVADIARRLLAAWEGGHDALFEDALRSLDELSRLQGRHAGHALLDSLEAERMEALESAVELLRERTRFQPEIRAAVHILEHLANPPLCLAQVG